MTRITATIAAQITVETATANALTPKWLGETYEVHRETDTRTHIAGAMWDKGCPICHDMAVAAVA